MNQSLFYLQWIIFIVYILVFNIGWIYGCRVYAKSKGGVNYATVATTMQMTIVTASFALTDLNKLHLLWITPLLILSSSLNLLLFTIPFIGHLYFAIVRIFARVITFYVIKKPVSKENAGKN